MVLQLTYSSSAVHPLGHVSDLDILREALAHNSKHMITGYLTRDSKDFVQTLEGDPASVCALYEQIKRDPRHYGASIVLERSIKQPMLAEWSMGYAELRDGRMQRAKDAALAKAQKNPAEAGRVVDFLRDVAFA